MLDASEKYCIVGAGPSGLAVAKNFKQLGIPCDCFEREDDVGGNWYYGRPASCVARSTHLISSKALTEFTDFPMSEDYPHYPSHAQAWEYLKSYARRFELYGSITFRTSVAWIEPVGECGEMRPVGECGEMRPAGECGEMRAGGERWQVRLSDGTSRAYAGVVIANGHNWDPNLPNYPGQFDGLSLHSRDYKTPDILAGKRVLVVGAGNSGCDIAVESAQHAARTCHSVRRGYHYLPKFLYGKPIDQCGERLLHWRLPLWLRRFVTRRVVKMSLGLPEDYGLPAPDHRLYETHPIVNSQMLYYLGHGRIAAKPDVERLLGDRVRFVDGSEEPLDVIVYATGYRINIPFIDRRELNWGQDRPELYLNVFHPRHDRLFVAGLIQPDSGQWGLVDYQAQLIARYVRAVDRDTPRGRAFRREKARHRVDLAGGIRYVRSPRHLLEVEHFSYRERLKKLIAQLA